jgi:hypothetical protein
MAGNSTPDTRVVDLAATDTLREAAMWWFALSPAGRNYWLAAAKTDEPRHAWEHYRRVVKEHQRLSNVVRQLDAALKGNEASPPL